MKEFMKPIMVFRRFKSSKIDNLLELEGKLLIGEFEIEPVFYLTIFQHFERKNPDSRMTVQFSPYEMIAFGEEVLCVSADAKSSFRFYSGGKENGKWITVQAGSPQKGPGGESMGHDIFINFEDKTKKIYIPFSREESRAFSLVVKEAALELYRHSDNAMIKRERNRFAMKKKQQPKR